METNSSPAEKLATANKSVRNWTIGFVIAAAFTILSIAATTQPHAIASAVMMFTAGMVVLSVHKREKALLVPVRV